MNIRAVIFDMDGCLVDSELIMLSAIADKMDKLEIPGAKVDDVGARFLGVSMSEICSTLTSKIDGASAVEFADYVERLAIKRFENELKLIDGVSEALSRLTALGVKFGVATGASTKRMKATLSAVGLTSTFGDAISTSDEVSAGKPAPDLFLLTADKIGVAPESCVVIEDSPFGIEGAVASGMTAIGFVGGSHLDNTREEHSKVLEAAGAVFVTRSFGEIVERIENMLDEGIQVRSIENEDEQEQQG